VTRRGLLAMLGVGVSPGVGQIATPVPAHRCEWVKGPYYVMVAVTYEEPDFYPPGGRGALEHCPVCGAVRLDAEMRAHVGSYYNSPAAGGGR